MLSMLRTKVLIGLIFLAATWSVVAPAPGAAPPVRAPFPLLGNDEAWQRLPRVEPKLPAWARALAGPLPGTIVKMLALDHLHRAKNPLGAVQAGKLRWVAADAIGCDYARRYAEADLRHAGLTGRDLKRLAGDPDALPPAERAALNFARKLTLAGHTVTDAEFSELLEHFGPEKVTAMVHTLAHANFQNRIFLALKVEVEPDGPLPPLDVAFDPARSTKRPAPARPPWGQWRKSKGPAEKELPDGWQERSLANLRKALDQQKGRQGRIPLPGLERLAMVPAESKAQASRVVWTKVSMGYQPQLTRAWFDCMQQFYKESRLDRVFGNTYFWVITRSNECFY
jgi:alkylhydroperoxidase family enzyme